MNFIALSGLPRTGSTLLSSILSQNPEIHAEGHSAVCQLMWDMQVSCENGWGNKAIRASGRTSVQEDLIKEIPKIYYKDVTAKHILDKSRSWTLPDNVAMLRKYITDNPKIIVMVRPVDEIVQSFHNLRKRNGLPPGSEEEIWIPDTEPLMRPLAGVEYAKKNNKGEYLFIEFDDFIDNPSKTINTIYDFCEWSKFKHWFTGIINPHIEDDTVWEIPNLHEVRPTVARRQNI
jgi:sulfotransferase